MTRPTPSNPFPSPVPDRPGPDVAPVFPATTVPVKPCGCLSDDFCTCVCDDTRDRIELAAVSIDPIILPAHADVPCLTDPALNVWRADDEWIQAMCPPLRWHVTDNTVSAHLGVNP